MRVEPDAYYVRVVTAHRGGEFTYGGEMRFASLESAMATARRLQAEFDADGEPRRVYLVDSAGVAFAAAEARVPERTW
jgi:hypothetical protein